MKKSRDDRNARRSKYSAWQRFRIYADLCVTSGFIPKRIPWVVSLGKALARLWAFIQIGEVKVVGAEHLYAEGNKIFCPNHSSLLDAIAVTPLMPDRMHYMSAVEEMRGMFGLKAIIMGSMGCFPVDRSRGKTVIQPAIDLLASGNNIMIFPEGKISPSGEYLRFKSGPARISIGAYKKLEGREPVALVPMHICYGTRDEKSALNFGKMFLRWRKGVTVTIDPPIYLHTVEPLDAATLIDLLRHDITDAVCDTTSGG